jgi:surface antigen
MVVGKLLILFASTTVVANEVDNPSFVDYRGGSFGNQLADMTFSWFRKLDSVQKQAYDTAVNQAVMRAENGQTVRWYESEASGEVTPVMTWARGDGYCRRMHIQAIAYNIEKTMSATACYSDVQGRWQWYRE